MKLREIAEAYSKGQLDKGEARELIQNLDLPTYDVSWEGEHLLEGDDANDWVVLDSMRAFEHITKEQHKELIGMFPEGYKREVDSQDRTLYKEMTGSN